MKTLNSIILFLILTLGAFVTSCDSKDEPSRGSDLKLREEGMTLSPGSLVHVDGSDFSESSVVIINYSWETGAKNYPEGYIKGVRPKLISSTSEGITFMMPYRKPAARVEVIVNEYPVGTLYITDGTTPRELSLYGITRSSVQTSITRCLTTDAAPSDLASWSIAGHPDFHSALGLYRAYGICGLAKDSKGKQCPYFLDLCTGDLTQLDRSNTLALFNLGVGKIGSIASSDGKLYRLDTISYRLEVSDDYYTQSSGRAANGFPLPDGLKAEFFGEYPGIVNGNQVLLSANRGNRQWTILAYSQEQGFSTFTDVEADALIPFSLLSADSTPIRTSGYIAVRNGLSELFILNDAASLSDPVAYYPARAISASPNHDRPGTLTVQFISDGTPTTMEYIFSRNTWVQTEQIPIYDEIVWIN